MKLAFGGMLQNFLVGLQYGQIGIYLVSSEFWGKYCCIWAGVAGGESTQMHLGRAGPAASHASTEEPVALQEGSWT